MADDRDALIARVRMLEEELLRVRTKGHAAAHELDNIAVECGLGHSPAPGVVGTHVRWLCRVREVLRDLVEIEIAAGCLEPADERRGELIARRNTALGLAQALLDACD